MRVFASALGGALLAASCAAAVVEEAAAPMETPAPVEPVEVVAAEPTANCEARAASNWSPKSGVTHRVEVFTFGETCAKAAAFMTIRNAEQSLVWTDAFATREVFYLQYAETAEEMTSALEEWIDPQLNIHDAKSMLPEWAEGAEEPTPGEEFPFYPEPGYERPYYEELRASDAVLFCYTQGLESLICLEGDDYGVYPVGLQLFPG